MRHKTPRLLASFLLTVASIALLATTWLTAAPAVASAGRQSPGAGAATDDPAAALFVRMCNDCHDSERIVSMRRTKADWEDTLQKMIEKGAEGTGKDFQAVFAYLTRNYGKVYINVATPDEITGVLGLSKDEAQAIIAFRAANGKFADLEGLKKVPSIDVKVLDAYKDALTF